MSVFLVIEAYTDKSCMYSPTEYSILGIYPNLSLAEKRLLDVKDRECNTKFVSISLDIKEARVNEDLELTL